MISVEQICQIARQAGQAIMNIYQQASVIDIQLKADHSPLTQADLAAHKIIVNQLAQLTPMIPILSEEAPCEWSVRRYWQRYWLVDPLDGTKEFIQRNGEFTVNIALIIHGIPVLGVIYVPVFNQLYVGDCRGSVLSAWKEQDSHRHILRCQLAEIPTILTSRSHIDDELQDYLVQLGGYHQLAVGSSLKFCLIADGKAQLYPRFGPTSIWDTAAGQAIVSAAGGQVTDWQGQRLYYHPQISLLNPGFCVSVK